MLSLDSIRADIEMDMDDGNGSDMEDDYHSDSSSSSSDGVQPISDPSFKAYLDELIPVNQIEVHSDRTYTPSYDYTTTIRQLGQFINYNGLENRMDVEVKAVLHVLKLVKKRIFRMTRNLRGVDGDLIDFPEDLGSLIYLYLLGLLVDRATVRGLHRDLVSGVHNNVYGDYEGRNLPRLLKLLPDWAPGFYAKVVSVAVPMFVFMVVILCYAYVLCLRLLWVHFCLCHQSMSIRTFCPFPDLFVSDD